MTGEKHDLAGYLAVAQLIEDALHYRYARRGDPAPSTKRMISGGLSLLLAKTAVLCNIDRDEFLRVVGSFYDLAVEGFRQGALEGQQKPGGWLS